MTRSSAWHALRGRRSSRAASSSPNSAYRGPRVAAIIATERVRPLRPRYSQFEEWQALEYRVVVLPSDENWAR